MKRLIVVASAVLILTLSVWAQGPERERTPRTGVAAHKDDAQNREAQRRHRRRHHRRSHRRHHRRHTHA